MAMIMISLQDITQQRTASSIWYSVERNRLFKDQTTYTDVSKPVNLFFVNMRYYAIYRKVHIEVMSSNNSLKSLSKGLA